MDPRGDSVAAHKLSGANKYVAWATATAFGLFGLLRLPWVEALLVLPLTRLQGDVAASAFHTPSAPISVTLACSGTEVIAMCLGAILAYPVAWRARVSGAALVLFGIITLNTVRIGTLGLAAADPSWFDALHLYLWPVTLICATSAAVFAWMRYADRSSAGPWAPSWRFAGLALLLLTLSAVTAPAYINSAAVFQVGGLIAHTGALTLAAVGGDASATGNVLWTTRGGFSVTGDCVATPLLPLYLAAVWIYSTTWPRRLLGSVMAAPIFFVLGVGRLLLVALPQSVAPVPEFASHTFYQVVLALVLIGLVGRWRHGARGALVPVTSAIAMAVVFVAVAGDVYTTAVLTRVQRPWLDPQGAVALLPPFQIALLLAMGIAAGRGMSRGRLVTAFGVLVATQVAGAWWLSQPGVPETLARHVSLVRAWAVAAPALLFAAVAWRPAELKYGESVQNGTVSPLSPP